jgi:transposase
MKISWLKVATIKAVSEQMKISCDEATGIPLKSWERAVKRGLPRLESRPLEDLAVDETSFQKRHKYVTVLTDRNTRTIIEILDDRKKATLKEWLEENQGRRQAVRSVSMDMREPFINAVRETIQGADQKICFDRFHVAACFGKALDKIRATEHRELWGLGISPLTRTKHDWSRTKAKNEYKVRRSFLSLTRLNLNTARAWRIKEAANGLWAYSYRGVAERDWKSLLG